MRKIGKFLKGLLVVLPFLSMLPQAAQAAPTKKVSAKRAPTRKTPAKKAAPVKKAPARKPAPVKKPVAKKPTPAPVAKKPAPAPTAKKPTPAPAAKKPTPAPVAKKPAPAPAAKKPAPAPAAKKPAPAPAAKKPTPAPVAKKPAPPPAAKKSAPPPAAKKSAPAAPQKPVAKQAVADKAVAAKAVADKAAAAKAVADKAAAAKAVADKAAAAKAVAQTQKAKEVAAQKATDQKIVSFYQNLNIHVIDKNLKDVGERWIELGEIPMSALAVKGIAALGFKNFTKEHVAAAEDLISKNKPLFTRVELANSVLAHAWPTMTREQKILAVVNSMFQDELYRNTYSFPSVVSEQANLTKFFIALINSGDINFTPAFDTQLKNTPNLLFHRTTMLGHLTKAWTILRYEKVFHLPPQAAKDFYAFNSSYNVVNEAFPLTNEKRLELYKALKQAFPHENWKTVDQVLMTFLKKSLPLDHEHWPDFNRNGEANFSAFIQQVIKPAVLKFRNSPNLEQDMIEHVEAFVATRTKEAKKRVRNKITQYTTLNNEQTEAQLNLHGAKQPLAPLNDATLGDLVDRLQDQLYDMEDADKRNALLKTRINFSIFCKDPFLAILRRPDQELDLIRNSLNNSQQEVNALKTLVYKNVPQSQRLFDWEFESTFSSGSLYGLGYTDEKNINALARVKRLYNSISKNSGEVKAAEVLYEFGAENDTRCIDGKRDRLTELERQYVYVAGGLSAATDFDATIGLNLAKLFMDHRTQSLRKAVEALYTPGEGLTYAWFRSHRALTLPFGLTSQYEEIWMGHHQEGVDPEEFITKYFKGGELIKNQWTNKAPTVLMPAFTVDKMAELVLEEIKKPMGGLFDDATLNYMLNSDLDIRKAYHEFQENEGDDVYENDFFQDASKKQREALKPNAIKKVLHRYSYIYERDDHNKWH